MNWKKIAKFQFKQILFIIAAFFLMVTLGGFFVSSVIRRQSSSTVTVALNETEKTILAYLREPKIAFDNICTAVIDMLDRGDSQEAVLSYLTQTSDMLTGQEDGIQGFTDVYGLIRGEFLSENDMGGDFIPQQMPWYQTAIRSKEAEYTAPYTDPKTGVVLMSLAREIYGKSGEYYGVMALDIDLSWLTDYAGSLSFAEGGYGMIVNQHLYTLAHPIEKYRNASLRELGADYAEISDMLRTGREVSAVKIKDTDGKRAIVFFKKLYNGWFVGVAMPVNSYYAQLYTAIFVLAVLGIVLAAILSHILLRLSGDKMRADEENRAKTSFLARMSHEIRTPLNAIIGIAQIQLQKEDLPEEYAEYFEKIYNSGENLLGVIKDILDMAKIDSGAEIPGNTIPYAPAPKPNQSVTREPMPYGKVLVVDDVETNLYVAETLLHEYELEIETAASGFAAIDKVNGGMVYDIIFMDHMMPFMDGIETVRKLRAGGYKGAIVALTANALAGNDKMFAEKGFDGFISKPIDPRQLDDVLNRFIRSCHPDEAGKYKAKTEPPVIAAMNPKIFEIFCRDAEKAIVTLRETAETDNLKLYATTAHAMKSASANVGEHEISESAAKLERAALDGDKAYISSGTEFFINSLETFIKKFRPEPGNEADDLPVNEDRAFLTKQMTVFKQACADYDDARAYAALDTLNGKLWKKETAAKIEELRDALFLHSDFEGAAAMADELCKTAL